MKITWSLVVVGAITLSIFTGMVLRPNNIKDECLQNHLGLCVFFITNFCNPSKQLLVRVQICDKLAAG